MVLLLENTTGTRNSIVGSFGDIAAIIDALDADRVGVCLDTCHIFAAGYELETLDGLDRTIDDFNSSIGLEKLKLVHLNDSKGGLWLRTGQHEHIGIGAIGEEGFKAVLCHEKMRDLSFILETPIDSRRDDRENLKVARDLASHR